VSDSGEQTGRCLCGKVTYTLPKPVDEVGACHCDSCRRWASGPFMALGGEHKVDFEGEEHIVKYRSSEWAERGFCGTCGTNLFYRLLSTGQTILSAGTLDDQSVLTFTDQVFIDEKPGFYSFANETKNMTGEELFALYAPKEGDSE
jgi:hypothetical protein